MGILAQNVWLCQQLIAAEHLQRMMTSVHGGIYICNRSVPVLLVVDQTGRVVALDPLSADHKVGAKARLVAQRPEQNAWMVLVSAHHPLCTVEIGRLPAGVLTQLAQPACVHHLVGLDVRFLHNIQSQLVAQIQKCLVRRIVRGANCADIVLLHHEEIASHILHGDTAAGILIPVMAVDTLEFQRLSVNIE